MSINNMSIAGFCSLSSLLVLASLHRYADAECANANDWQFDSGRNTAGYFALYCVLTADTDAYSGDHSMEVKDRTHNWATIGLMSLVDGGRSYVVTSQLKLLNGPDAGGPVTVKAETHYFDAQDTEVDTDYNLGTVNNVPVQTWIQFEAPFTAPSDAVRVVIQYNMDKSVAYLIDEIILSAPFTPEPLEIGVVPLKHFDFEAGINNGWPAWYAVACTTTADTTSPYQGAYSITVTDRDVHEYASIALVFDNVLPNKRYDLFASLKLLNGNVAGENIRLNINAKDANGGPVASPPEAVIGLVPNGCWRRVSATFTTLDNTHSIVLKFAKIPVSVDYMVDEVTLTDWQPRPECNTWTPTINPGDIRYVGTDDFSQTSVQDWQFTTNDLWSVSYGEGILYPDGKSGGSSVLVSPGASLQLFSDVEPDKLYYFFIFVKFEEPDENSPLYETVHIFTQFTKPDGAPYKEMWTAVDNRVLRRTTCWHKVAGDFVTPVDATNVRIRLVMSSDGYSQADEGELYRITPPEDWVADANERIKKYRQSQMELKGSVPNTDTVVLKVKQTHRDFHIGSAVAYNTLTNPAHVNVNNFFNAKFGGATLENKHKWTDMERTQGVVDYEKADEMIDILENMEKWIRAHNILWPSTNPTWVEALEGQELLDAMFNRIDGFVGHYKRWCSIKHYDVINEYLSNTFYSEATGIADLIHQVLKRVANLDRDAKLFMNEFHILQDPGAKLQSYIEVLRDLMQTNTPLHGIGVQLHVTLPINILQLMRRLRQLVKHTSLPILITEMTVSSDDVDARAAAISDLTRLFFSTPAIEGLFLWGFWKDDMFVKNASLVEGPEIQLNAAGSAFFNALDEWTTDETYTVTGPGTFSFPFQAFHGEHTITVERNGVTAQEHKATVEPGVDISVTIDLE